MSSGALFPTLVPGSRGSSSKYLVEFRAGKMSLKGSTVTPDKRKGLVYIQQTDDSLIHFCWKDRTSGNVEDDLIIFPDDCEFKRVSQCTTGRVFVLKFKAGSKRLFFWMQEPKTEKDEEHCRKVNEYLNNPPMPGALGGSGSGGHELSALGGEGGLQSLLGNMSHNQLMQLIGPTGLGGLGGLGALTGPGLASLLGSGGPPTSSSSSRPAVPKVPFSRGNWTFWFFVEDVSFLIQEASSAVSSPSSQRSIESMLGLEKSDSLQNIQEMLQSIQEALVKTQETMAKNHEEIKNEIRELRGEIRKLNEKMGNFQQMIGKNEQRIQKMEEKAEQTEKKVEEIAQVNKGLEKTVIVLEMEKAAYFLRFQNIEEEKGEDLMDVMTELLAGALQKTKREVQREISDIFRIHSNYARRHKLPREVHVRFTKKTFRDEILKRSREKPLKYKGKQNLTLKQVPRRVRDQRRQYQFLTTQLIKYNVIFRWLIPEGILVIWQNKRFRLDSLDKAHKFFDHHFTASEEQESREEIESKRQEEIQAEEKTSQQEESENEKRERAEREGARARTTRKVKPIYK
ncbi:proteasomal ubiquitin receptor ADRM1 isoform X1 [Pantherophis guttatus]|uniref:Proteasomal ubiquitin receptor ADRM1 isoform X1 n=1 Tax=Pantherophis guttatus TaxID=94885 RepID=A0ABM3ZB23_PANGU|nr:proteasomal ubiquitin receptor ADRM1 isoform X1 [Pantherophis guttatus]